MKEVRNEIINTWKENGGRMGEVWMKNERRGIKESAKNGRRMMNERMNKVKNDFIQAVRAFTNYNCF